jgi:hypothetical protein
MIEVRHWNRHWIMIKTTKALIQLVEGVHLFRPHQDQAFIDWCHHNGTTGFVWNACEQGKYSHVEGKVHRAELSNGQLCGRFRNRNEPNGCRPNLSTKYRKVVSNSREALAQWARAAGNPTTPCGSCSPD